MRAMIYMLGAVAAVGGALIARPVLACPGMHTQHGSQIAAAGTEHAHQGAAAAGAAKAKIGDEVVCAVDGMKMRLSVDTPAAEYGGKTYYFCSEAEKQKFLQKPEQYIGR